MDFEKWRYAQASVIGLAHLNQQTQCQDRFACETFPTKNGEILIAAGLHAPNQMGLRDDLATRLAWGLVYQLHPLNDGEKALALKNHAKDRGIKLPNEVIEYCLRYLRRDLPTLMATLDALDEWSLTAHKPVTVPMLRKLLQLDLGI